MSILNKYKRWVPYLIPIKDEYWDFVLSQDDGPYIPYGPRMSKRCLSSYIEFGDIWCQEKKGVRSYPDYTWDQCVNNGPVLEDIGYTGIDNGLIYYGGYDKVTNKEFYDIFTNSVIKIDSGDCKMHLHQVTGNTCLYSYPLEYVEGKYYTLTGGFFQGFYKLHGFDYQILPQYIENEWNIEIVLRPKFAVQEENTLNMTHEGNAGIFFYMGTRAEDKFSQLYNTDFSSYEDRVQPDRTPCDSLDYILVNYPPEPKDKEEKPKRKQCDMCSNGEQLVDEFPYEDTIETINRKSSKELNKRKARHMAYFLSTYGYNEFSNCGCHKSPDKKPEDISGDVVPDEEIETMCLNYLDDDALQNYFEKDVVISGASLYTSDGVPVEESGYYEIETDNKFLTFNRTKYGFTTANWDEDTVVVLTGSTRDFHEGNLFLLMHRGCSGYTTQTIDQYYEQGGGKTYDFMKDVYGNSFALKRNEDGSISYRYLVLDCDKKEKYSILEETSFPNLLPENKWANVHVKFSILNGNGLNECGLPEGKRKMRIFIYVNGYLKFISKELPEFDFRALDTQKEKQEGVPFNISVGGGTQGLCDSVWLDYYKAFEKILPIEKYFAGTFIGDLKVFRFYTCKMSYPEIKNNWLYDRANWL